MTYKLNLKLTVWIAPNAIDERYPQAFILSIV